MRRDRNALFLMTYLYSRIGTEIPKVMDSTLLTAFGRESFLKTMLLA